MLWKEFEQRCNMKSDIALHLPLLTFLASKCKTVTEFGTRTGNSTVAFLAGCPRRLTCYDLNFLHLDIPKMKNLAEEAQTSLMLVEADTSKLTIDHTDMLFIDTLHQYDQITAELRNAYLVSMFIVIHDTIKFGQYGERNTKGIMPAINEFLEQNPEWEKWLHMKYNNGLMVLTRKATN